MVTTVEKCYFLLLGMLLSLDLDGGVLPKALRRCLYLRVVLLLRLPVLTVTSSKPSGTPLDLLELPPLDLLELLPLDAFTA